MKVSVPTGAPAVPAAADHKYQAQVAVAENPNVTGYVFSGWTAATENGTAVNYYRRQICNAGCKCGTERFLYSSSADL